MKHIFVMILMAVLSLSTPSYATDELDIYELKSISTDKGWIIRMFGYQKTKLFAFCSAERMYKSNVKKASSPQEALLSFLLGEDVFGSVVMLFDSDLSDIANEFVADVDIDEFHFRVDGGLMKASNSLRFTFPKSGDIFKNMMSGRSIKYTISSSNQEKFMVFDLIGSREALEHVLNCVGGGAKANIEIQQQREDNYPHFPD